jgi:hypothetical protein
VKQCNPEKNKSENNKFNSGPTEGTSPPAAKRQNGENKINNNINVFLPLRINWNLKKFFILKSLISIIHAKIKKALI